MTVKAVWESNHTTTPAFLTICRLCHRHVKIERKRLCSETVYSEKRADRGERKTAKVVTGPGTPDDFRLTAYGRNQPRSVPVQLGLWDGYLQ